MEKRTQFSFEGSSNFVNAIVLRWSFARHDEVQRNGRQCAVAVRFSFPTDIYYGILDKSGLI